LNRIEKKIVNGFSRKQLKLYEILIFCLKFLLFAIVLQILMLNFFEFRWLTSFVAKITYLILSLFGDGFNLIGNSIIMVTNYGTVIIDIIKDCTGWKSFMAFFGLLIATRGILFKKRVTGIIIGAVIIFTTNILRLTTTIGYAYLYGMEHFKLVHDVLWQFGLIVVIVGMYYVWYKYAKI
jgi:exosortase/archaeosortase family protein